MKRFYCTICKRVKRVRVIPSSVVVRGDDVRSREGQCSWHNSARRVSFTHSVPATIRTYAKVGK